MVCSYPCRIAARRASQNMIIHTFHALGDHNPVITPEKTTGAREKSKRITKMLARAVPLRVVFAGRRAGVGWPARRPAVTRSGSW
jgi:hypothetical protein